jgi:DNA-binding NarL/FixJ family response regulator
MKLAAIPHLSPRETQICLMLPSGATNPQIAAALQISVATVKEHLGSIFQKFGCHDRTQVAIRYVQSAANARPKKRRAGVK